METARGLGGGLIGIFSDSRTAELMKGYHGWEGLRYAFEKPNATIQRS
jgi:hypothetical protein